MKSKIILPFLLLVAASFFTGNLSAQVKKTMAKKKVVAVKKITPSKKIVVVNKTVPIRIKIVTDSGTMVVRLYDSTPLHRNNFVKLVKQGFYDSLLFHRVIPGFMIQGGDPASKIAEPGAMLGNGGGDMSRIPAEFKKSLFHKKGVLAAARDGNPEKASSACQFYLVEGKIFTDDELNMMEMQKGSKIPAAQRAAYKTIGGTPQLDQNYTVFGEIESGIRVIDKIANMPRDNNNRPLTDIRMHMEVMLQGK